MNSRDQGIPPRKEKLADYVVNLHDHSKGNILPLLHDGIVIRRGPIRNTVLVDLKREEERQSIPILLPRCHGAIFDVWENVFIPPLPRMDHVRLQRFGEGLDKALRRARSGRLQHLLSESVN